MFDDRHRKNTFASSTMVTDGERVYAFFESAGVYAYDLKGKLAWKKDLGGIIKAGLGPGTSPIIYKDLIILQCDQEMGTGSYIVALDRKTGEEVWRANRDTRRSWATPLVINTGTRDELIASGAEVVIAYDPATGKELWRANGTQSHPIPSPVATKGLVFLTAGSQAKVVMAMKPGGSGDLKDSKELLMWRYNKGAAYVPSPIAVGDYLYLLSDAGIMTCIDARDRRAQVRRGPRAGAGDVLRVAGRLRRQDPAHQRRRRLVRHRGRAGARGPADQLRRRAGLRLAGDCQRHHLHPRRQAPVRHPESQARK